MASRFSARQQRLPNLLLIFGCVAILTSCSSLLPDSRQETQAPWSTYADARAMFDKIVLGKTTLTELRAFGVDPDKTPNVALLSNTDLLRRLLPSASFDLRQLDEGLQECIAAKDHCFGYEIEQSSLERKRRGNFWLDFLNFERQIDITGWQFDAVVVIKKDTVVYKTWSGKPSVRKFEEEHSPLGPLQGLGSSFR